MRQNLKFQDNSSPVKTINGQLPDESGNVTIETGGAVDESRLLPENPTNGDIPCYSNEPPEGVNYNDANTVLLLQGSSDNTAAASTSERLNGIVTGEFPVQSDGSLLVTGSSNYITFNDADTRRVFSGEFTLETYIKTTQFTSSGPRHDTNWCVVYRNDASDVTDYQWLLFSDFYADAGKFGIWPYSQMSGETFPKTLVNAEFQHVAIDVYMVDGVRKFTMYRNGVPYHTGNYWSTTPADWSSGVSAAMRLFGEGPDGGDDYLSNASVMSLRVSNVARYKGVSFDPPADGKYLTPPAGYWGKLNKAELVQSVNGVAPNESGNVILDASTIIDNSRLLPVLDALPEGYEGSLLAVQRGDGKVADENTLRLMHFNDDVRDVVADETGTLKGNASITPTGYFAGALSINHAVVSSLSFNGLTATPTAWTMDFRVKLGRFSGNAPIVMIGTNLNETQTSLIRVDSSYIDIQATYNQRVIYKTHSLQLDTWYHFALTYDGTMYKFYIDGKLFGSGESTNQFDFTRKLWFGSFYDYSTSYVSDCTIDEFRLSNVVRWTENFTPPDAPYGESLYNWGIGPKLDESRLLPETGSVSSDSVGNPVIFKAISRIDNTYWLCLPLNEDTNDRSTYDVATEVYGTVNIVSNAPSSPGGSAFFNGSSCLHGTLPAQFGTSDFTVRFWMMAPTIGSSSYPRTLFSIRQGDTTSGSTFALHGTEDGKLFIYSNTDITSRSDVPSVLQAGIWHHVAVVRKSGVATIYVDGNVYASGSFTNSLTRQIFGLGASWTGSSYSEAGTVYLTSLDVLNYAAYDGAFTTPAYQPGILAGAGYEVATDSEFKDMLSSAGIDESRLVPTGGRNGNLLEYQEGVDRGNNVNTKLLLQPATSDGLIVDQAAGNAAPVGITNSGNVAIAANALVFSGENALIIEPDTLGMTLGGNNEYSIEVDFQLDQVKSDWATLFGGDGSMTRSAFYINSSGATAVQGGIAPNTTGWTTGTRHRLTIERFQDGDSWKTVIYRNGAVLATSVTTPNTLSGDRFPIGSNLEGTGRNFVGKIWAFRISNKAEHRGISFAPRELPFLPPAGQPVWAEGIDRSRLLPDNPTNGDMAVYRKVPEDAAPQNLTSATSDSNWEVTWSGAYSGRVGWQAFDSDQLTTWCTYSAAVGDWLCWEYKGAGGKVLLRRYSIAKGSGNGDCPTGWKIQGSNDGSIWVDLDEQTGQSFPDNNAKEYTIPNNSTPYKFHRFYLLSWNTSNMIGTFKAWSWINSTDECNRWVTVDIADLQGTSENEITLVRPVSDQSLFPIIEASADVGFTSVQTINARTVAGDRAKIKVFNGSAFADFPDSGLGTPYDEQSVVVDVSGFIAVLGDSFYVRYKWESSDGTASDYKAAKFPLSVAQTPVVSTGGGTGNVSYQTFAIPAQSRWTLDPEDSTRQYVSVASGRCSCIVYDESGTEVGIEVQYVSSANETRLVIPSDLAGGTITTGWTCRYAQISES